MALATGQYFINILGGNTIGHQGKLHGVHGALAQSALARKLVCVPKIHPTRRCYFELVGVICEYRRPHKKTYTARLHCTLQQVWRELRQPRLITDFLKQAITAGSRQFRHFHFHYVPGNAARIDLHLDLCQLTIEFIGDDAAATFLHIRFVKCFNLRSLVSTTVRHHRQVGIGLQCDGGANSKTKGNTQTFIHYYHLWCT
ncbi:hypothetical protein D3C85_864000 [compost metagenome]